MLWLKVTATAVPHSPEDNQSLLILIKLYNKVGQHIFYNKVQNRLVSRLFLALGTEGKNGLTENCTWENFEAGI